MRVACIDVEDIFFDAIQNYTQLFGIPLEARSLEGSNWDPEAEDTLIVFHNKQPEDVQGITRLSELRRDIKSCSTPVFMITDPISENAKGFYTHQEFFWSASLPFDASQILGHMAEIKSFMKTGSHWMKQVRVVRKALASRNPKAALEAMKSLGQGYPYPFHEKMLLGDVYMAGNRLKEAEQCFKDASELYSGSMEVHNRLATIYSKTNRNKDLAETMAKASEAASAVVQRLVDLGHLYMEKGDFQSSTKAFEEALEKEPGSASAQEGLITVSLVSGDNEKVKKIIKDSPYTLELARIFNFKGIALAKAGQHAAAETLYRNAFNFLPDQSMAYKLWFNLGLCMRNLGDHKKALESFEKAKKSAPRDFLKADPYIAELKKILEVKS